MASVITVAFENWKAQEAASGKAVLLDEFVFANVPNLDPTQPIDRNEKLPPANQIVHRQAVNKAGLASENAVAYSVTLGADVGNFDFNWIGLLNKASGTVAMITHAPIQKKLKNQNGQQGNVLTRSFILEFQGAAEETQIKTSAETWQIDFTARLSGIDEMQRLINVDSYGAAAFFNDGFEVTRSGEQYTVKKGLGYVGGLRGELAQNQILNGLRNTKVYADFSYQGNIVSQWNTVVKITSAATLNNYIDAAGFTHQVFAIASIDASGNVKDLRSKGALSSQEISALEARLKLDLNKKFDKANISGQKGNDNDKVPSLNLFTTEIGKLAALGYSYSKIESDGRYQPKGNYAPAGDYATNTALTNGLNGKFDKTGGQVTGSIIAPSITVKYGNIKNVANLYSPQTESGLAYFQYSNDNSWFGRLEVPRIEAGTTGRLISNIDLEQGTNTSSITVYKDGSYYPMLRLKRSDGAAIHIEAKPDDQPSLAQLYRRNTAGQIEYNISFPKRTGTVAIEGDSYKKNESDALMLGINQKWTDVKSQRSKGTTYTNTTGKPIVVMLSALVTGGGSGINSTMTIDDVDFIFKSGGQDGSSGYTWKGSAISIIIPTNSKYKFESIGNIESWLELRA
ncbi:phage tail protein [Providencia rettgeri]